MTYEIGGTAKDCKGDWVDVNRLSSGHRAREPDPRYCAYRYLDEFRSDLHIVHHPSSWREAGCHENQLTQHRIKALLIDLNGTLHVGNELTPRAAAAVGRLRAAKIPFVFW